MTEYFRIHTQTNFMFISSQLMASYFRQVVTMHNSMRYMMTCILHFTQKQSWMTKTHDETTDGRNGFTMYFNKFTIYKEIATKMGQTWDKNSNEEDNIW